MNEQHQQLPALPIINYFNDAACAQISALLERKEDLQKISTDITDLIARYNQQKSYLGHAAHWYGELNWWFRIIVSTVAAGVAIVLTVPWVISIALSFVASCLLMNHYEVTHTRDRLIYTDLNEQNTSVQNSLSLLNNTKIQLEISLESLHKLYNAMKEENQKLCINVDAITQQSAEYRNKTIQLESTIEGLIQKNELLSAQFSEASEQLRRNVCMLEDGTSAFAMANDSLKKDAKYTEQQLEKAREASEKFVEIITPPPTNKDQQSQDSDNVLQKAVTLLKGSRLNNQIKKAETRLKQTSEIPSNLAV